MQTKLIRIIFLVFVALLSNAFRSFAQHDPAGIINKLYNDYPQEKIYLWFNKPGYIAGETSWFKIFVFSGYDLSHISTNVSVELYNSDKKVIQEKYFPLFNGVGQGSLELDSSLAEGVYYVRAYTKWMLNFDESFQYIKAIPVYNPLSKIKLKVKDEQWTVKAFPEGGSLIDGSRSKVAIRLFSSSGLPASWKGFVEEEGKTNTIAFFRSFDPNVSSFELIPEAGKKYKATVIDIKGKSQTILLPEVKNEGLSLSTQYIDDSIVIEIRARNKPDNAKGSLLIGHIQNELVAKAAINSTDSVIQIAINTSTYYNGILHLTLFDAKRKVEAERLVFLNPSKLLFDSAASVDQSLNFSPRSANELTFQLDSLSWNNYAVSILDTNSPLPMPGDNLLSNLWLSSDLFTPVYHAADLLLDKTDQRIPALDALMITEKWKRFQWEELLKGHFPEIKYFPENFLTYTGTEYKNKKVQPLDEVNILLSKPGLSTQLINTTTDSAGRIKIDKIIFNEQFDIYFRKNNKKYSGMNINIKFDQPVRFFPYSLPFPESEYSLSENLTLESQPSWVNQEYTILQNKIAADARYKLLQEVVIRSNAKSAIEKLEDKLVTGKFSVSHENIFDFVNEKQNLVGSQSIFLWLQGRVSGLETRYSSQDFGFVPFYRSGRMTPQRILLYLNEGETTADWLNLIPLDDIIMIKVITAPRTYVFGEGVGLVIAVYTSRDNIFPAVRSTNFASNKLKGYDDPGEYFFNDYDNTKLNFPEADQRSELWLQPVLVPEDSLFKAKVKFYNNDSAKKFRMIIQGFDQKGFPVYINKVIGEDQRSF